MSKSRQKVDWTYNPFEIAFLGEGASRRSDLLIQVMSHCFQHRKVACVQQREEAYSADAHIDIGVHLVRGDGQHGLMYPEHMDAYLGPRPLLDADCVFVETPEDTGLPSIVCIEDDRVPECEQVVAYVGDAATPPKGCGNAPYYPYSDVDGIGLRTLDHFSERIQRTAIHGLVLAGGRSTRMKRDKAALDYHGVPQVIHSYHLMKEHCDEVFVSIRPDQADDPLYDGLDLLPDRFVDFGQMGGILTALKSAPQAAWLVLACDLPFVEHETLAFLLSQRNPFKLSTSYISSTDGFPEPLCAIYEPKSIFRLLHFFALGYHCPRKVLINSDTELLEQKREESLTNANSPAEYEAARAILGASKGESV